MRYQITEGPVERPQRLLVYGPEGIGKSTFASQMPNPLFVDVEDGTGHLYAVRLPVPRDWAMLIDECASVAEDPGEVSTIVVDSIDAAERLCHQEVTRTAKKPSIESWGYGKGYTIAAEKFDELLGTLDACVRAGVNVVMIAHSQMRKFERPDESGAYDRFEIKMHKLVASKAKEWSDAVLFLDYETFVSVDDNGKGHASGGKRVIRTSHSVSWDAKNRWGLPEKMPLDSDGIAAICSHLPVRGGGQTQATMTPAPAPNREVLEHMAASATDNRPVMKTKDANRPAAKQPKGGAPKRLQPLFDLCTDSGINPAEVRAVMVAKGKRREDQAITDWEAPFVQWLVKQWPKVVELVMGARSEKKAEQEQEDVDIPF